MIVEIDVFVNGDQGYRVSAVIDFREVALAWEMDGTAIKSILLLKSGTHVWTPIPITEVIETMKEAAQQKGES